MFNQTRRGVNLSGGQKARQVVFDISHCPITHRPIAELHWHVQCMPAPSMSSSTILLAQWYEKPLTFVIKIVDQYSFRIVTLRGSSMKGYCTDHF